VARLCVARLIDSFVNFTDSVMGSTVCPGLWCTGPRLDRKRVARFI
jgi:hypothetical protein